MIKENINSSMESTPKQKNFIGFLKTRSLQSYTMVLLLVVFAIVFSLFTDGMFITPRNLSMLVRQMTTTGMLSIGMVLIIIHGNIDLSVGSVMLVCSTVAGMLQIYAGFGIAATLLCTLALGVLIGMWNGFWVAYRGLPSFIVTMGTLMIGKGVSLALTKGKMLGPFDPRYQVIGQAYIPPLAGLIIGIVASCAVVILILNGERSKRKFQLTTDPLIITIIKIVISIALIMGSIVVLNLYEGIASPVLIMIVVAMIFIFITRKTKFGRNLYAIGSNREAAKFSGIKIKLESFKAFALMGLLAALAGIVITSRLNMATSTIGNLSELDAISACVIGGVSMAGGIGSIPGALAGALLVTTLDNGMSLMNFDSFWQYVVKGLVLTLVVWYDMVSRRRNR